VRDDQAARFLAIPGTTPLYFIGDACVVFAALIAHRNAAHEIEIDRSPASRRRRG